MIGIVMTVVVFAGFLLSALAMVGVLRDIVFRPIPTLSGLQGDPHAARHGALVLAGVSLVYTLILAVFISVGYPAAAPSALGLAVEDQYRVQIWYQAPLFFATTAVTAGLLLAIARLRRRETSLGITFARISLATAVPFALTTMLVESAAAVGFATGLLYPTATLEWLTGPGSWFAALYQVIGLAWLAALVVAAAIMTVGSGLRGGLLVGAVLLGVYGLPVALLIR